jgi:hypothetical protein
MDKELVTMMDAPEIQGKWKPKPGDRYISTIGTTGTRAFWKQLSGKMIRVIIGLSGENIRGSYLNGPTDTRNKYDAFWIPRIEDILEMLGGRFDMLRQNIPQSWDCHLKTGTYTYVATTPIKALLKAYMHIEHGKQWTPEGWV